MFCCNFWCFCLNASIWIRYAADTDTDTLLRYTFSALGLLLFAPAPNDIEMNRVFL